MKKRQTKQANEDLQSGKTQPKLAKRQKSRGQDTGYDLWEILIFTYRNRRDCLIEKKRNHQKGVGVIVLEQLTLIGATVRKIIALTKDSRKKIKIFRG